jgi:hypothetical protein
VHAHIGRSSSGFASGVAGAHNDYIVFHSVKLVYKLKLVFKKNQKKIFEKKGTKSG